MNFTTGDSLVIAFYIVCITAITIWHTRKKDEASDFLLAGRKLTLPVFVTTIVATWYGSVQGIAEFVETNGLGAWLVNGPLWYVIYLVFALFFATRIRQLPFYTVADILEDRFGKKVAYCGGIFTYIMVNPGPIILSLGFMVQLFFPALSIFQAVAIAMLMAIVYTIFAGFRGVVYTDFFQCVWMYAAFLCLAYFVVSEWGGPAFVASNLSSHKGYENHLSLSGGMSILEIFAWGGIACVTLVDPNFYQRCYAANSPKTARRGILLAILFWAVFDILSVGLALYAFAARNHHIADGIMQFKEGALAHIAVADFVLPSPLKGFFFAGIFAAIMSTADSYLFVGAANLCRDFYWRQRQDAEESQMVFVTRLGIIVTALFGSGLAIALPSVVLLWYTIGTIGVSAILVPMLVAFFARKYCNSWAALASMISGAGVSIGWFILQQRSVMLWGIPPLYPGLLCSLVVYFIIVAILFEGDECRSGF